VDTDVVVVGGGIVGLATAFRLLVDDPGRRVTVVEKEAGLGRHQSSHNSGVIHAGVYYAAGSLKAELCRAGKKELERFADDHDIRRTTPGKHIVATDQSEFDRFDDLAERARANGVEGLRELDAGELAGREPHVAGLRALWSPTTGSIDFADVCQALADEVTDRAGVIRTRTVVLGIEEGVDGVRVATDAGTITARVVVACAGLQADRVAAMSDAADHPTIVGFRGAWLRLHPRASGLVSSHVYPVPDPRFPFLGVHLSPRVDGEVWIGPNAVLAAGREAYDGRPDPRDLRDAVTNRGLWRLVRRFWKVGALELYRDRVRSAYLREVRRYVPELRDEDVLDGKVVGIRAQALGAGGNLVEDFVVDETAHVVHVRNAPSPAATASLAIGRMVAERVEDHLA